MRYGTALLVAAITAFTANTADAKRSKGNEIAKLRAEIQAMKQDLLAMKRRVSAPPPSSIVESILRYPPEGIDRLLPPILVPPPTPAEQPRTLTSYRDHLPGVSMKGAPAALQDWMRKVAAACPGFKAISVCRPGARVAGSGRISLHASCRAVDFQVRDYACAQAVLKGFPGGLSTDPYRVKHLHASWSPGGREWKARFAHGGGRSYYAKRYKSRYAARHRYAIRPRGYRT